MSSSQLIRVIGVLLYFVNRIFHFIVSVRSYSQIRRSDFGEKKFPYDIPWISIWCMTSNKAPSSTPFYSTSIPKARMSDKAAHGETHSLSSLHAASDVMIPGGRSSVINSVASRTQTPCRAHSNEWGSSVPSAGIATFSGSHSFWNDKKSFFSCFETFHYKANYLTL